MIAESRLDRWFGLALGIVAFVGFLVLGCSAGGLQGCLVGGLVGLVAGLALPRIMRRGALRRRKALAEPFPETWRRFLQQNYDYYRRLPPPLRDRFEDDIKIFLSEKRITGVGVGLTDELQLLAAASAVTLSLGWPDYDWSRLTEVLMYPDDFDRDYSHASDDFEGLAHPWGTVILSIPSLWRSFRDPDDPDHVGIHEFAHILDLESTHFDGIPTGVSTRDMAEWESLVEKEMERLQRKDCVISSYGAHDPAEFFAVAVEAFFETSLALRRHHPDVYRFLSVYFNQDPAAWNEAPEA